MKRIKTFLIIFLLTTANYVWAEDDNTTTGIGEYIEVDNKSNLESGLDDKNREIILSDTIKSVSNTKFPNVSNYYFECYHTVVNKYGKWQGIGKPLTEQERRHNNRFFKLLRPKNHGASMPFTHMQIINNFDKLTTAHGYRPHITPDGSWESRCSEVCQLEKIFINGQFSKENFYNAAGELVLSFSGTFVDSDKLVGHYTDASGVMATLRKDKECKYLTIQYDENGYESCISYHDEKGFFKLNEDGVHTKLRINDKDGKTIQFMSGNLFGEPSLDNWGNSGWTIKYDHKGYEIEKSCIDSNGHIMPMPGKRKEARDTEGVTTVKYKYDRWGNLVSQTYYGLNNEKIKNKRGIHKFVYKFNSCGQRTMCRAEDLNRKLVTFNDDKTALWTQDFDKNGNLVNTKNYDEDSILISEDNYVFKGNLIINETQKKRIENKMILTYKKVNTDYADTIWNYNSKYIEIINRDIKGRIIADAYYDLEMKPYAFLAHHKVRRLYTDKQGYSIEEECYYDTLGNLSDITSKGYWRDYNRKIIQTDSINKTKTYSEYNGKKLNQRWTRKIDDAGNYSTMTYHDSLGCHGRTIKADALYYRITPKHSMTGTSVGWVNENEFGEPSYVLAGDWDGAYIYCMSVFGSKENMYFDENGDTIPNSSLKRREFKDALKKVFCLELVDSVGFELGLRTGDLILGYGDWTYVNPSSAGRYWENMLCYETALRADTIKKIIVMRYDKNANEQVVKEIILPKGTPMQLGFIYHMLYLTKNETNRYRNVIKENVHLFDFSDKNTDYEENDKVNFIIPYKVGSTSNKKVFNDGFKENAIVLMWEKYKNGKSYKFNMADQYIGDTVTFNNAQYDSIALYYTVDAKRIKRYVFNNDDFRYYVRRSSTKLPDGGKIRDLALSIFEKPKPVRYLTPEQTMSELSMLLGTKENVDSIKTQVNISYNKKTDWQMFKARELFAGIDYSDFILSLNDDTTKCCWGFIRIKIDKDRICEIVKTQTGKSIQRFTNNIELDSCYLLHLKVEADGQFVNNGIRGNYLFLKCNNWRFGMSIDLLQLEVKEDNRNFVIAEIIDKNGKKILGTPKHYTFGPGTLGIRWGFEKLPVNILFDAAKKMKKLKD